jgi:hypothetical protein
MAHDRGGAVRAGAMSRSAGGRGALAFLVLALAPVACSSTSLDVGRTYTTDAGQCTSACDAPLTGPLTTFSTAREACDALVGQWQVCAPSKLGFPSDVIGVEFGACEPDPTNVSGVYGGELYLLVGSASGPVRGGGFAHEYTYDVGPEGPTSYQIDLRTASGGTNGGVFEYSACPREFSLNSSIVFTTF